MALEKKYHITTDEMEELYLDGETLTVIGKLAGCKPQTIHKRLKKRDVVFRSKGVKKKLHITEDEIKELYLDGKSPKDISRIAGCGKATILYRLKGMGVEIRKQVPIKLTNDEIKERYLEGATLEQIGNEAGRTLEAIRQRLLKMNVEIRSSGVYKLAITKDEIVKFYNGGLSVTEISVLANCTTSAISRYLREFGVESRGHSLRTSKLEKQDMVDLYKAGVTIREIAKEAQCTVTNVQEHLKNQGVELNGRFRKYFLKDDGFFETIDTEEKAYILGLIYADGCNQPQDSQYTLTIALKFPDRKLLEQIRDIMYRNHRPIYDKDFHKGSGMSYYVVSNKQLSLDLVDKGVMQAKSLKLTWPTFDLYGLERHFIRGYIDGDGSIMSPNRWSVVGTYDFIYGLQDKMASDLDMYKNKITELSYGRMNPIYSTGYGGRIEFKKTFHYLYDDATIYLERKYQKFISEFADWERRGIDAENLVRYKKWDL